MRYMLRLSKAILISTISGWIDNSGFYFLNVQAGHLSETSSILIK